MFNMSSCPWKNADERNPRKITCTCNYGIINIITETYVTGFIGSDNECKMTLTVTKMFIV